MPEDGLAQVLREVVTEALEKGGVEGRFMHGLRTEQTKRLRARRVDEDAVIQEAVGGSLSTAEPVVIVQHGGTVVNSYQYPAETEGVVVVAWHDRWWCSNIVRIRANGATLAGVMRSVCPAATAYVDRRFPVGGILYTKALETIIRFAAVCVHQGIGKTNIDIKSVLGE